MVNMQNVRIAKNAFIVVFLFVVKESGEEGRALYDWWNVHLI